MNSQSVTCTGASVQAAPANPGRSKLLIQNSHPTATFWVNFAAPATQDGLSLAIGPGTEMHFTAPDCPTEPINVNGPAGVKAGIWEG